MSNNTALAGRYAKAAFELAVEKKSIDKVEKDFLGLQEVLSASKDFVNAINNPVISRKDQVSLIKEVLKGLQADSLTVNSLSVLADNGRIKFLSEVIKEYFSLVREHRGEVVAQVVSAFTLSSKSVAEVEKALSTSLGKKVILECEVKPEILGGVIITMGSKMLDSSVSAGLDKLKILSKEAMVSC